MSWDSVALGTLCDIYTGKRDVNEGNENGTYPFFTCATKHTFSDVFSFDCEAILVAGNGAVGQTNYYKGKFEAYQRTYVLCNFKGIIPHYLLYFLNGNLMYELSFKVLGNTIPYIKKGMLTDFQIPLPPISTQQKIVAKLDKIFAEIDKAIVTTEANAKNTKALFLSYLVEVFNRSGDGWIRETIGNICSLRSGATVSPSLEKTNGELPYLKVADMNLICNQGSISSSSRFVNISDVNKNSIIRKGSTIFPKRGGAIDTNKKRITNVDIVADLNIMSVLPNDTLNSYLLYFYFLGLDMRKLGSGSSIRQINNYDIEPLTINFPKSHTEQQGLVSLISKLQIHSEKLISNYKKKKLEMVMLKQSILQQAFNGQLVKAA